MLQENSNLETLIKLFSKLPSLGPRSARRIVLHLLDNQDKVMAPLIFCLKDTKETIKHCQICGNLDSFEICSICSNKSRDESLICVVEEVSDLWAIEKSGVFKGKYHILGGVLSAINGKGPGDLNIATLVDRIKKTAPKEIILATNSTMEGQTTAFYLLELLKEFDVKISKLTSGIPIGSELDYLDEGTLGVAFKTRGGF
ncbi:MAG: recR [Rickettsiaceae bacterium]|jgi:recombination protein RecR|nr:recR [Rickettsiaceae bacterium]